MRPLTQTNYRNTLLPHSICRPDWLIDWLIHIPWYHMFDQFFICLNTRSSELINLDNHRYINSKAMFTGLSDTHVGLIFQCPNSINWFTYNKVYYKILLHWTGWSSDNASHFYSGDAQFKSRSGHKLPWRCSLWFPRSFQANSGILPRLGLHSFLPNPFQTLIYHSTLLSNRIIKIFLHAFGRSWNNPNNRISFNHLKPENYVNNSYKLSSVTHVKHTPRLN